MEKKKHTVVSIYLFKKIINIFNMKNKIKSILKNYNVKGIVLLAPEGFNVNISFLTEECNNILEDLRRIMLFSNEDIKLSYYDNHIFRKIKIKIKKEILSTNNTIIIDKKKKVGEYIKPKDWDGFIKDPNVILIDTRNDYEIKLGTFKKAINPGCKDFTSILEWIKKNILIENNKGKKIAMFCTGGIRCEKATSFIKSSGFNQVFHLKGGILNYFKSKKQYSSWVGECFVFDNRVSVNKKLEIGTFDLCYACRMPINASDKNSESFKQGISCPNCKGKKSLSQLNKFITRQHQYILEKNK